MCVGVPFVLRYLLYNWWLISKRPVVSNTPYDENLLTPSGPYTGGVRGGSTEPPIFVVSN